jgi:uncharacterized metal-binding protein YceD (DUF177 family)
MNEPIPEFSRLISVARLPPKGTEEYIEAKPTERAALAKRFDVVEISSLKSWLTLTPSSNESVAVAGKIQATVLQHCVVTLDPLISRLEVEVDLIFVPSKQRLDGAGEPILDDREDIETFDGGKIDIGEMVAQNLGVNIDPYPRKPDAVLEKSEYGAKIEKRKPFAQLVDVIISDKSKD